MTSDFVINDECEKQTTATIDIYGRKEIISGPHSYVLDKINEYCAAYGRVSVEWK